MVSNTIERANIFSVNRGFEYVYADNISILSSIGIVHRNNTVYDHVSKYNNNPYTNNYKWDLSKTFPINTLVTYKFAKDFKMDERLVALYRILYSYRANIMLNLMNHTNKHNSGLRKITLLEKQQEFIQSMTKDEVFSYLKVSKKVGIEYYHYNQEGYNLCIGDNGESTLIPRILKGYELKKFEEIYGDLSSVIPVGNKLVNIYEYDEKVYGELEILGSNNTEVIQLTLSDEEKVEEIKDDMSRGYIYTVGLLGKYNIVNYNKKSIKDELLYSHLVKSNFELADWIEENIEEDRKDSVYKSCKVYE